MNLELQDIPVRTISISQWEQFRDVYWISQDIGLNKSIPGLKSTKICSLNKSQDHSFWETPQHHIVKSDLPCSYYLYFFHVDGAGAQIPRGVSSTEREIEGHKEPSTTKCSYLPGRTLWNCKQVCRLVPHKLLAQSM